MGRDIQNMKTKDNTEIKGTMTLKYFEFMFTNSGKCKEVLIAVEHARKGTKPLNGLL